MNFILSRIYEPPRVQYPIEDLGENVFKISGKLFKRVDGEFISSRQKTICYSVFSQKRNKKTKKTCLIYCTGNRGDRRSCLYLRPFILPNGVDIAAFDYNGLGHSEKDYISYGIHEKRDLRIFVS